ncbi:hypothetical protein GIB67_007051 [Kingdonia uniflora]|uniref:Neutral ceramidase n=1 Tax=Kingdonia uniflora TaxID=39325 RepID=A0A7J7P039_9MAGN|nr:hypothetical protein GIB67_007051 [Kingdonia uniflora]
MLRYQALIALVTTLGFLCLIINAGNGDYLIGVGSYDMTGPASDVNMMGYASMDQSTAGIHFRLRARAFVVAESAQGARFAFVNLDAGMGSQLVMIKVLERLKSRYGKLYNENNLAISGTHTHAGPGGYLQYVIYIVTSLGFVKQSFEAIVTAVEQSIVQAHNNLRPGSICINTDVENAGINRSPSAYLFNPAEERARYPNNVDTQMTLLKFVDGESGKSVGAFSWFATHGTSMSKNNRLISGDNKGAAARFFEDWFQSSNTTSTTKSATVSEQSTLMESAGIIKATGGQSCDKTSNKASKVRKNDGNQFVGAFCQSNVGDVSPNVLGAFCIDTGLACDFNHSSCSGNDKLCVGRGPGYPDEIKSTKIIAERQFQKAIDLFTTAKENLIGKIDYRQVYLNFTDLKVDLGDNIETTCPAALGLGFAAGTTDGPGASGFQQGDTNVSTIHHDEVPSFAYPWRRDGVLTGAGVGRGGGVAEVGSGPVHRSRRVRNKIIEKKIVSTSSDDVTNRTNDFPGRRVDDRSVSGFYSENTIRLFTPSQGVLGGKNAKGDKEDGLSNVLMEEGADERFFPLTLSMANEILRLGKLVILSVPGEFTTMAGRRLREAVKKTLIDAGNGEFDDDTHVVIAGLTNTYSQYVATFEEYKQQRYEGASTLYGPHTLSAYIQEFKKLATSMAKGDTPGSNNLSPPDLSSVQLSLLTPPFGDSILSGKKFGDIKQDIVIPGRGSFQKGERVKATFWSANPRNDLLTEGTFAVVEKLQAERWVSTYDDDDFCLFFKWGVDNSSSYGFATIEWEIPVEAISSVYRIRHFGSSKSSLVAPVEYFTGASSAFTVS